MLYSMASGVNMTCPDCTLNFPSMKVFLKHREKFCGKSARNDASSERSHIKSVSVHFNYVTNKHMLFCFLWIFLAILLSDKLINLILSSFATPIHTYPSQPPHFRNIQILLLRFVLHLRIFHCPCLGSVHHCYSY